MKSRPAERPKTPRSGESLLLFENDHTCCICRERGKDVQIHHIDGNKENNDKTNLAVVCLDDHSKVTGGRGLGRRFSPQEVAKYKGDWERVVRKRRQLLVEIRVQPTRRESDYFRLETKNQIYRMAASRNIETTREILEFLYLFDLFERVPTRFILGQLSNVVPFMNGRMKRGIVAEHILHFFWHLPGPQYNKISKGDVAAIKKAGDLLIWLAEMEIWSSGNETVLRSVLNSLYELFGIAKSYKLREVTKSLVAAVRTAKDETSSNYGPLPLLQEATQYLEQQMRGAATS